MPWNYNCQFELNWRKNALQPAPELEKGEGKSMKCYITVESFGADIPENWEEIAHGLNTIIDECGIADDQEAVNELWDEYWRADNE